MIFFKHSGFLVLMTVFMSSWTHAETIVAKRNADAKHLIPLRKLTVGPDDQYHGTVSPQGDTLVFTRKTDLVPHLCSQSLKTGEVLEILPLTADSQEPAFGPDGKLAFTYFKFKASGDICYQKVNQQKQLAAEMTCLKIPEGEPSTPFWKNAHELGFLLRNPWTQMSEIIVHDIDTETSTVLAQGKIWSPAISEDGRTLFYNELIEVRSTAERSLMMKDLQTGEITRVRFTLPGISGFPTVSRDGQYLYFSHYLNDTNHDHVIDGKDNSVIFRVSMQQLKAKKELFPEQLTSVETNCSFPRPSREFLYVTCAFEGALDLYEIPLTGIVPPDWDQKTLNNAHQTARTYSERVLILNTLKFKYPELSKKDLEERILSNHLLNGDIAAAQYSIQKLQSQENKDQKEFYQLLNLYLEAKEKKETHRIEEVTPVFKKEILEIDSQMDRVPGHLRFKRILKGLLRTFLNQTQSSANFFKQVSFSAPVNSLERFYFFQLANWVIPRIDKGATSGSVREHEQLSELYVQMMKAPEFSEETQIYYGFEFLKSLQDAKYSTSERIQSIEKFNRNLPSSVSTLLKSEVIVLKIIQASNEQAKKTLYQELDPLMSSTRNQYFLRKALYVRAILNFEAAAEFLYLSFIASNWIRYTQSDDIEYSNARKVFANSALEQAYDALGQNKVPLAGSYFYGSLSLTDDLESHSGFIRSQVAIQQRSLVDQRYSSLKEQKFIDDNMKFVDALLILIDAHPRSDEETGYLENALEKLKTMTQDRDSALRYLFMGYCYFELLFKKSAGYEFDHDLFEDAHRNLMLAYDQARDNPRVSASALMSLGILHQRVQNYGLSVRFFSKRKALGFISNEEQARLIWFYAKSLSLNHRPEEAAQEISHLKNLPNFPQFQGPFLEREAFYLQQAGKYSQSAQIYEDLFRKGMIQTDINRAKVGLSYGYDLFKLKKNVQAEKVLREALETSQKLKVISKGKDRWIDFDPSRIQLIAYGLLSQLGSHSERIQALQSRMTLLNQSQKNLDGWMSSLIQSHLQMAELQKSESLKKASGEMQEAIQLAKKLSDSGQSMSHSVYRAAVDYFAFALSHQKESQGINDMKAIAGDSNTVHQVVEQCIDSYHRQRVVQPILEYQELMLRVLRSAYSTHCLQVEPQEKLNAVLKSELSQRVRESLPEKWDEIHVLCTTLMK